MCMSLFLYVRMFVSVYDCMIVILYVCEMLSVCMSVCVCVCLCLTVFVSVFDCI